MFVFFGVRYVAVRIFDFCSGQVDSVIMLPDVDTLGCAVLEDAVVKNEPVAFVAVEPFGDELLGVAEGI